MPVGKPELITLNPDQLEGLFGFLWATTLLVEYLLLT